MIKWMLSLAMLTIFFFPILSTAREKDKDLVALWLFDEGRGDKTEDATGNKNNGTLFNCKWVKGKFGSALEFNGKDSCVTVPDSKSLTFENNQISITAWLTQDGTGKEDWHTVVCKGNMVGGSENYAVFTNSKLKYICTTLTLGGGDRWWTISGNGSLDIDKKWHHFATTYNGKDVKYYLNGKEVAVSSKASKKLVPTEKDLTIGCRVPDGIQWHGKLDEIGFFQKVLNPKEIQGIMNDGYEKFLNVDMGGKLPIKWGELKRKS